jgi:hypothetical protein
MGVRRILVAGYGVWVHVGVANFYNVSSYVIFIGLGQTYTYNCIKHGIELLCYIMYSPWFMVSKHEIYAYAIPLIRDWSVRLRVVDIYRAHVRV